MLSVYNTFINKAAFKGVSAVLSSTFLSEGELVKKFEKRLDTELKLKNTIALNSGTSALHLALILTGVREGDEVICPAQTFVATGLSVLYLKATPVFADIDYETGNISPDSIKNKITPKTKAIIIVHWAGYPCEMDEILAIAKKNNIPVIEDAAHALGAEYKGRTIGAISDFTCLSFQAIKHLTTGDGGAICCADRRTYDKARTLRWFGIDRKNSAPSILGERKYNIRESGYKYHMNDYSAALGLANLSGFKKRIEERRKIAQLYRNELGKVNGVSLFTEKSDRKSAYWQFGFHVEKRSAFIKALSSRGIMASVIHQRIDRNSVFGGIRRDLIAQKKFDTTQIHIPIHDGITANKAKFIVENIKKGW